MTSDLPKHQHALLIRVRLSADYPVFDDFGDTVGVLYFGLSSNPDVHGHIISRALLVLFMTVVITFAVFAMKSSLIKSKTKKGFLLRYALMCAVVLGLIIVFIWALSSGHLWVSAEDIHPNALWDLSRSVLLPLFAMQYATVQIKASNINRCNMMW